MLKFLKKYFTAAGKSDINDILNPVHPAVETTGFESENSGYTEPVDESQPTEHINLVHYSELPPFDPCLEPEKYLMPSQDLVPLYFQPERPEILKLPIQLISDGHASKIVDLVELKTVMVLGSQGSGKTTFLHYAITSLLFNCHPSVVKFLLADVKGVEFNVYNGLDKHFIAMQPNSKPIISNQKDLEATLNALCVELEGRLDLLREANLRNFADYNDKFCQRKLDPQKGHLYLPKIVLVIDDLDIFTLYEKDPILKPLERIVKGGYTVGIFSIISTSQFDGHSSSGHLLNMIGQKVCFNLFNRNGYRKIFDTVRIDKTLNPGEFLFNEGRFVAKYRTQIFDFSFVTKIVPYISSQPGFAGSFILPEYRATDRDFDVLNRDPLFEDAARLIVQSQMGSTSLLQRRMKLGYNRAGRLMDQLEAAGIVGPPIGAVRDVLYKSELELEQYLATML